MSSFLKEFEDAKSERQIREDKWIDNLRRFKGEYDTNILRKINANRSRVFVKLTRTKTLSLVSRLSEMLFPGSENNWGINPTPVPNIAKDRIEEMANSLIQQDEQTGEPVLPSIEDVTAEKNRVAKEKSDLMAQEIEDQLKEIEYHTIGRKIINSGALYGTGIMKGPINEKATRQVLSDNGSKFSVTTKSYMRPLAEHVPVWDVYPDMSGGHIDHSRFMWQWHTMSRNEVQDLASVPGFKSEVIMKYLKDNPKGDSHNRRHHDALVQSITGDVTQSSEATRDKGRFRVLERWGLIDKEELASLAEEGIIDLKDFDKDKEEVETVMFMLGDNIIKLVQNPFDGGFRPYHFFTIEFDETGIYGPGIPEIMDDAQDILNGGMRMLLDNAAISAGPQIAVDVPALTNSDDYSDIYAFKTWPFDSKGGKITDPIKVFNLDSHQSEIMQIIDLAKQLADEETALPALLQGITENLQGGVGRTSTGVSMLLGGANVVLKDIVKNFDAGVTEPFIKAMYLWNMQFNPRDEIKFDMEVVARGSTSLVAKEVRGPALELFAQNTLNPEDSQFVDRKGLLVERAKNNDLPVDKIIKSDQELSQSDPLQEAQQQQAFELQQAQIDETKAKAERQLADAEEALAEAERERADAQEKLAQVAKVEAETDKLDAETDLTRSGVTSTKGNS